jgi:D-beta-D-heptose 7-phosphate kinase/D-beta-D-heptose 1-phosphate adenosyltransferase
MMRKKIAVIGDFMLDHYYHGEAKRLSPEAPVPVVLVNQEEFLLGGAGNVVKNLKGLGVEVLAFGIVGKDKDGLKIIELLEDEGISIRNLYQSDSHTTTLKSRILAEGHQIVRLDREKIFQTSLNLQKWFIESFNKIINEIDVLVISDYGKGLLTDNFTQELISLCKLNGVRAIIDPKGKDFAKYRGAYLVTPNKQEAALATGIEIIDQGSVKLALEKLREILENEIQVITLGSNGIALLKNDEFQIFPALSRDVIDVSGAGDTVIASLAFQLSFDKSLHEAIIFANKAASIVVQKSGAAAVTLEEVQELSSKDILSKVYANIEDFEKLYSKIRIDKKVVFTNGCFDILHLGHIEYLKASKTLGDLLVVGLNSDSSVKSNKGPSRPINNEFDRAKLLSALEFVDFVVVFNEETPIKLLHKIRPDILVKGGDYSIESVVGREFASETVLMPFLAGKSTSEIIEKIKGSN